MAAFTKRLAALVAALLGTSQAAPCNIAGFETFCEHWNSCREAPMESAMQNGQCLYARMVGMSKTSVVERLALAGAFRRVLMVQGPDAVARAAGRHCTAAGRGRMMLNVGWTNPSTAGMFSYTIFTRPCATSPPVPPQSTWMPESAPLSAAWSGVKIALRIAYNSSAHASVWDTMAANYSYAGGGLGPVGIALYGKPFLEVCQFGDYRSPGCCWPYATIPAIYRSLADAFSQSTASSSTANTHYMDAPVLRAFLSNALALNPFFNGDGYTFDGCTGWHSVVSNSEFFLPNKHNGAWDNSTDSVSVGEVTANGRGFSYVWGPADVCNGSSTTCDATDGTAVSQATCAQTYGQYPDSLLPFIFGGATSPCTRPAPAVGSASAFGQRWPLLFALGTTAASFS